MKRIVIALVAAGAVFSVVFAAAASLGGLTSVDLGADDSVVASCDTDGVTVDYVVSFDATAQAYQLDSIDVIGIAATCVNGVLSATLTGTDVGGAGVNFVDGDATVTVTTTQHSILFTSPVVKAEDVDDIHVLIVGP